jgi:hypothetical protein
VQRSTEHQHLAAAAATAAAAAGYSRRQQFIRRAYGKHKVLRWLGK